MATVFRFLSVTLLVAALAAMLTLLADDAVSALRLTSLHQRAGALSFLLIGASYLLLQFAEPRAGAPSSSSARFDDTLPARRVGTRRSREKLKAIFMGLGFIFWGSASLLPPGPCVTAMDTAVVLIFVLDLSLIILDNLKRNQS